MGIFSRLKQRLTRTRAALSDGLSSLFRGGRAIDRGLLDELEELLYTADLVWLVFRRRRHPRCCLLPDQMLAHQLQVRTQRHRVKTSF